MRSEHGLAPGGWGLAPIHQQMWSPLDVLHHPHSLYVPLPSHPPWACSCATGPQTFLEEHTSETHQRVRTLLPPTLWSSLPQRALRTVNLSLPYFDVYSQEKAGEWR